MILMNEINKKTLSNSRAIGQLAESQFQCVFWAANIIISVPLLSQPFFFSVSLPERRFTKQNKNKHRMNWNSTKKENKYERQTMYSFE